MPGASLGCRYCFGFGVINRSVASPPLRYLRHAQAIKVIDVVNPLVINAKTFTPQKLPDYAGNQNGGVQVSAQ